MSDSSFLSLVAVGGAAIFGLHGALGLAIKQHFLRNTYFNTICDNISLLKGTSIFRAACAAVIFYCMVLFILIRGIYEDETNIFFLNVSIIMALLTTCYYSFRMFFRSCNLCVGCIRVHMANLLMSFSLLFYNFH